MSDSAAGLIEQLGLIAHPEGGWYRQTWQGPMIDGRPSGTAILFLLRAGELVGADRLPLRQLRAHDVGRRVGGVVAPGPAPRHAPAPACQARAVSSTSDRTEPFRSIR